MNYNITQYSFKQAEQLGVFLTPSSIKNYKIDVLDKNFTYITSIGSKNYSDYPTYILTHGLEYANRRRALYKLRHNKDRNVLYSRGWFADKILW